MTSAPTGPGTPGPAARAAADPQAELLERVRHAALGEYEVSAELGRGGMATVYLAHDLALDRKVAIKVMSPALVYGPGMVERFKREARTAAALSHPNIIPVYAVREAEGLLFFVMKLVQGTPLDAVIRELGPLPLPMVEAILAQVGSAFGYAHRQGVIHRDIKPGNIMIDEEGWAVVTDFGIAKVTEADGLTLTGMAVGTPTYMSPEQCSGGGVTGASDQYSLGVVAYEMLTGRPPFQEPTVMSLMFAHATRTPPPLVERRPDCPEVLQRVVERMLAKDPAERWLSLEDAVAALGARSLSHDDPTRTKLMELARTSTTRQVVARAQTPRSPIPLGRSAPPSTPVPLPVPVSRPGWQLATGLLGGIALTAVFALVLLRDRGGAPPTGTAAPPGETAGAPGPPPPDAARPSRAEPRPAGARGQPTPVVRSPPGPTDSAQGGAVSAGAGPSGVAAATAPGVPAPPPPPAAAPSGAVAESQVTPVVRPPEPVAVPPTESAARPRLEPTPVDERMAIEAVVQAYARALEAGRVDEAVRLFPAMPAEQRQGLEAFYRDGGSMQTRWSMSEVAVNGSVATLRIQGTSVVRTARTRPTEQRVSLRGRLERGPSGWRLTALVN